MRLIVADDAALLREGLAGILERQGHEVIGQASTAPELEALVQSLAADDSLPDVVITDVRMPPTMSDDGLAAATRIRAAHPHLGILVLSQYIAPAYAAELFAPPPRTTTGADPKTTHTGGLGYLLKERVARITDFTRSLGIVAAGGIVVDPDIAARLLSQQRNTLHALSPREYEVLGLMARGLSNTEIAEDLALSIGAVAKHVANTFTKLGLPPGQDNRRVRAVLTYLTTNQ